MRDTHFWKKYGDVMEMRKFSDSTQKAYFWHLNKFFEFKKDCQIDKLSSQDIYEYLVNLNTSNASDSFFNQAINAIRFFFKYVLNRKIKDYLVVRPKRALTQPVILDKTEMQRIFDVCKNSKHKAILALMYSCGLRRGEVLRVKLTDVDNLLNVIRVKVSKGRRDRVVPLNDVLKRVLGTYIAEYAPTEYLFNGQSNPKYSGASIQQFLRKYAKEAGIEKRVYPHLLRHGCLTNLIEEGTDIRTTQVLAGHKSIKTTMRYCHISPGFMAKVQTPLNSIQL